MNVQATGEAFSPKKGTTSASKIKSINFFLFFRILVTVKSQKLQFLHEKYT